MSNSKILFYILWLIIAIEDYLFFEFTWLLSIIMFALLCNTLSILLIIISITCLYIASEYIGNGDIPFLIYFIFYHTSIYNFAILLLISTHIHKNGYVPLITALFLTIILTKY